MFCDFRKLGTMVVVAGGVMVLTVALAGPFRVQADDDDQAAPALRVQGCTLRIVPAGSGYQAGDEPELLVVGVNPTQAEVRLTVGVQMLSMEPMNPASRMMPMPRSVYQEQSPLVLAPGTQTQVRLASKAKLTAGHAVTLALAHEGQTVQFAGFSVPGPAERRQAP